MRKIDRESDGGYVSRLLELSRILNSSLDLPQVLRRSIDEVVEFVGAERGFILVIEDERRRVIARAAHGIDLRALETALAGQDPANSAEVSRRVVEHVLTSGSPMSSTNAMEDPRFSSHTSVRLSRLRSVLCVPLIFQDRLLGIVYVDNRLKSGAFNQRDMSMLASFANQAAVAIENARLYESLRGSMEEKLRLQAELHEKEVQRIALAETSRAKTEAIGFVAHELRNPLTVIAGSAQTMLALKAVSTDMFGELAEMIDAESHRMMVLINEMLDTSALEAGKPLRLSPRPVDLRNLLEQTVRAQRFYKHWKAGHSLTLKIDPEILTIEADEDKLRQIVANLLTNAIKYSPDGGEITVGARITGDALVITVTDRGVGMTVEQSRNLFAKFERVMRDDIRQIPGTGLGLYLTRELVRLHGGTIDCESAPGDGTAFRVSLPLRASRIPPADNRAVISVRASAQAPVGRTD